MLTDQIKTINNRLTYMELSDVDIYSALAKITKFTNNIKFGLDVVKSNYRVSSSPLCGEDTFCGENTLCDETVYHETNQLPEPSSLVQNNIYSEADFISILYDDLSILTLFSSVDLVFESHIQALTSYTFDGSELSFKLDGTELSFSDYLTGISLKNESQEIVKIDLEPMLISSGSMIDITINLLYELVKQNKLYNFLDENYYSNNISLVKTWLNDNLTHLEVGNADVVDGVVTNYVPVIRKPVIKTTIEDSVICEAFFDTDEINGTYTAVRYFINGTDTIGTGNIAFTVITSITKNETENLTLSVELNTDAM